MRDRIHNLGKAYEKEAEGNSWLLRKLESNQRRLELERQFLPLLHKARGPVGPQNGCLKGKKALQAGLSGVPAEKLTMAHSASSPTLDHTARPNAQLKGMPLQGGRGPH